MWPRNGWVSYRTFICRYRAQCSLPYRAINAPSSGNGSYDEFHAAAVKLNGSEPTVSIRIMSKAIVARLKRFRIHLGVRYDTDVEWCGGSRYGSPTRFFESSTYEFVQRCNSGLQDHRSSSCNDSVCYNVLDILVIVVSPLVMLLAVTILARKGIY